MAHQYNGYHGAPHGSPPPNPNDGYEALMGSLISPGPGTPLQQKFPPWGAQAGWPLSMGQGNFSYSMPYQGSPLNQTAWQQNAQNDYNQPEYEDDDEMITVDDTDIFGTNGQQSIQSEGFAGHVQASHTPQKVQSGQHPSLSSSSPLALPQPRLPNTANDGLSSETKFSNVNSTTRAAELRAKLLASRSSNAASRQQSPAVKASDISEAKKQNVQELLKQTNGALAKEAKNPTKSGITTVQVPADTQMDGSSMSTIARSSGNTVTNDDFAFLFAEAQNAADAKKSGAELTNGNHDDASRTKEPSNGAHKTVMAAQNSRSTLKKDSPDSELSEPGEIHSGTSTPTKPPPIAESDLKKAEQVDQEKREKLLRQNEVSKAYQPLKESKAPTSAPRTSSWEKSSSEKLAIRSGTNANSRLSDRPDAELSFKTAMMQSNDEPLRSNPGQKGTYERPPTYEEPRRNQEHERARGYNRREDERNVRRSSLPQVYSKPSELEREVESRRPKLTAYRQRMTEDNSRRAAEYKKTLEAQGFPVRQATSDKSRPGKEAQRPASEARPTQSSTSNAARKDSTRSTANKNNVPDGDSDEGEHDPDTVMLSPTLQGVQGDEDINDWLELTNYHDLEFREKRLRLFRKKRMLEMQRAELEREEQELQGIHFVARAQSVLPASASPKITRPASIANVKMPPPPLPLNTANNDVGIKIKDTALSAGLPASQNSTPTNKRQHADDDSDNRRVQPAEKIARTDINGHASNEKPLTSPASVKAVKEESTPLESRISRENGDRYIARSRLRSRSPEFRRRSRSPTRGRYSEDYSPERRAGYFQKNFGGVGKDHRNCFNCNLPGHNQHHCTEPRRDGKDWSLNRAPPRDGKEWTSNTGYQKWVSPNYLGRNPLGRGGREGNHSPHIRPGETRSRYDSVKQEDADMGGYGDNIGSGPLNLGAGGKPRR